jgi:hypothetical protein
MRRLSAPWKALLSECATRFMIGSDTWVNQRWQSYEALMQDAREWLGDLDAATARRIAWDDGASFVRRAYAGALSPTATQA